MLPLFDAACPQRQACVSVAGWTAAAGRVDYARSSNRMQIVAQPCGIGTPKCARHRC